jgi:hypothetical protein
MSNLYETDFFQWTQETSDRLRRGEFTMIDVPALAEEVEDLGKRQKSALQNRLAVLIGHLLKWDQQTGRRSSSWQAAIKLQRSRIERLLNQSPSLRAFASETLPEAYSDGVLLALKDTGLDEKLFPKTCPYTVEEILRTKDVSGRC